MLDLSPYTRTRDYGLVDDRAASGRHELVQTKCVAPLIEGLAMRHCVGMADRCDSHASKTLFTGPFFLSCLREALILAESVLNLCLQLCLYRRSKKRAGALCTTLISKITVLILLRSLRETYRPSENGIDPVRSRIYQSFPKTTSFRLANLEHPNGFPGLLGYYRRSCSWP